MRIASVGHAVFAASLIAIGILGLINGSFAGIWEGVPKAVPAREALIYLCALVALVSGLGLFLQRTAAPAARLLLVYLLLWMLLLKGYYILLAPGTEVSYENWGETAVLAAAAWVLYAWFADAWDQSHLGFAIGDKGVRIARVIFGLALIAFGLSHYAYATDTASLVPAWLPVHLFWVYFTGTAYVAAGVAVLAGFFARLAVTLVTVQMAGFTLLIWAPYVATGHPDPGQWSEFVDSWVMTTAAWVVADSYPGVPWFAMGKR